MEVCRGNQQPPNFNTLQYVGPPCGARRSAMKRGLWNGCGSSPILLSQNMSHP